MSKENYTGLENTTDLGTAGDNTEGHLVHERFDNSPDLGIIVTKLPGHDIDGFSNDLGRNDGPRADQVHSNRFL